MDSYLDYSESESESSSSEASSLSESASVPEFTWGFVTGKGGKTKKVGFICSYLEDKEWIPVKNISRVQGKPGTICVWFSQTTSNTGRPNDDGSGRKNKEYVDLEDYVACKDSVWENLEGIKDAEQFARSYQVMQQRETQESADSSPGEEEDDSGPYDFQETPKSNKRPSKQSHNPKALEDKAPHPKYKTTSKGGSGRKPEWTPDKKKQKRKAHVNTPPSKKKILKRPYPGTNRSSSDSEEDGELAKDRQKCLKKTKTQKSKGKTPQNSKSSYPFRHEVSLMRAEHPELEGAREDQPLNKKDTWWRHELVPSVTSLQNSEINSQRQAQLTVSTMSKRCYSLAEGIMDKWEAGVYQGQPSTEVKQTLFFCLNGLNKEQMVFDLLQKFHDGQFKHWKEFELAANAIKLEAKVTTEELSKAVEELRKEKQQWQQEKQRLTSEVGDGNEKEQCQQENQRLTSEVEELRKEKQQWQQEKQRLTSEVEKLKKEKQRWQQGDNHPSPEDPQDKKKTEEHEQEDLHQNRMPVLEQVKEGEWVAVWYGRGNKRTWYPGKVLNVDKEKTHTELKVEFLTHDRDSGKFKKPKFDDIQTVNNPVFVIGTNLKVKKVKGGTLYDVKEKDEIDNICKNVKTPVMND